LFQKQGALIMQRKHLAFAAAIIGSTVLTGGLAQAQVALTGQVTSAEEGAMEGVVVTARKDGARFTVSVVSDNQGRYSFPAAKLEPGRYALAIRAIGYDLDGPAPIDLAAGQPATADLKLRKTRHLSAQLTNAEWLISMGGTDAQKKALLNCTGCHTLERIVKSTHDADAFINVFERMTGYFQGSIPGYAQRFAENVRRTLGEVKPIAEFMASVNLSKNETWNYMLKTLPRPKGRATRVIVTEYDLPREQIQPHDVIVDSEGIGWVSHFGENLLGRFDPKTGDYKEYTLPILKKGLPVGNLDLEFDKDQNLWIGMMQQGGVAKLDKRTGVVTPYPVPLEWQTDASVFQQITPTHSHIDGKAWAKNSEGNLILRLDVATGKWENLGAFKDPRTGRNVGMYGMPSDSQNNVYLLDINNGQIGRLDAKTLKLSLYRTPIPNSRPRRGRVDAQDRLWFGEFAGNAIGMFDPKTETIFEWSVPTPWGMPYDVVLDKNGDAWTGSMLSDRISRLDPKTGEFVEYLLPRSTNIRRVFVDNSTKPVTFWVGNTHGASIVKLEPLD
jgi:streptogramin lyase